MKRLAVLLLLAACGDDTPVFVDPVLVEVATFPAQTARELDLLFMIDDSTNGDMQVTLAAQVGVLLDRVAAASGELPSLHIGVVTSDLGTTGSLAPEAPGPQIGSPGQGGCAGHGKDGVLQTSGAPITGAFIVDEPDGSGGRSTNYTGELAATLGQMVRVGSGGCGFEQPFGAIRRGLTNPVNVGFMRPSAQLAVVMLADEDDCSFLDPALVAADPSVLGALESFRCTRQGIVCDQSLDEVGSKTGCRSNEESSYVESTGLTVDFLRELKRDRSMIHVGALVGDPSKVSIALIPPPGGGVPQPGLENSCRYTGQNGSSAANPGVRYRELVDSLGSQATLVSSCETDYAPQLHAIARVITPAFGVTCLDTTRLADASTEAGVQPTCEIVVERDGVATPLPMCAGEGDCYELVADAAACPDAADHLRLVTRIASPPADAYVRARCEPWPPR
jgi:hypothetical protein